MVRGFGGLKRRHGRSFQKETSTLRPEQTWHQDWPEMGENAVHLVDGHGP